MSEEQKKQAAPAPSAVQTPDCPTCRGNGMIGGPSYHAPDEGGVPCPDCWVPQAGEDARPVAWSALTDEQIEAIWQATPTDGIHYIFGEPAKELRIRFARALLAAEQPSEDRRDAERYRWLRERNWNESALFVVQGHHSLVRLGTDCPSGERLDATIDAAIAKGASA